MEEEAVRDLILLTLDDRETLADNNITLLTLTDKDFSLLTLADRDTLADKVWNLLTLTDKDTPLTGT